jgi:CheY-like chemotaxis protein
MVEPNLSGLRVLVVEDEALVAMALEDTLEEFGCEVVDVASRIDTAQTAIRTHDFDCAILDINVHGEPIYPVAETLDEQQVPFIFLTGYDTQEVMQAFRDRPVLHKPLEPWALRVALARMKNHTA